MMRWSRTRRQVVGWLAWTLLLCGIGFGAGRLSLAQEGPLTAQEVAASIEAAKKFLVDKQNGNGSWTAGQGERFEVGVTSLAVMALINGGMTPEDRPVKTGLEFLRKVKSDDPDLVYEVSLMIMALAAAKEEKDNVRILQLARRLERAQIADGDTSGSWSYSTNKGSVLMGSGDRSNAQFAVLGLREAAHAGIPVSREVWERSKKHWENSQNADGSWGYVDGQGGTGSMTAAGITTLVIIESMLQAGNDRNPDGTPACCGQENRNDRIERGIAWMGNNFQKGSNPGAGNWLLYYHYGLERAGRLSGRRFFGNFDWYREVAEFLVRRGQNKREGWFRGVGGMETDPVVGTCFALLFLSKGLAPVLINKLEYGPEDVVNQNEVADNNWNQQTYDVRNLVEEITGLKKWPKLLTWQVVSLKKVIHHGGVEDLLQSPVLYISGREAPELTEDELKMLREFVNQGGFIFGVGNCSTEFEKGFRTMVKRMYPQEGIELKPLTPDHPIYRAEYLLDPGTLPLEGADFGCRTAIVLAPSSLNLSCLWGKWTINSPPKRDNEMKLMIAKSMQVGVNIIAYATGREPPKKLDTPTQLAKTGEDPIERGLLQVAKLQHSGGWDTAPTALHNLLIALNNAVGTMASEKQRNIAPTDPNLFKYPLVYMHGREKLGLSAADREALRKYLDNGGVLFADACCGSRGFDQSFRELVKQLYPDQEFKQIPVGRDEESSHELFTTKIGYDIRTVQRRAPEIDDPDEALNTTVKSVQPFLEGIEIDGRLVVIYSKYDISCALQRQASVACAGYVPDDATKIAINVVLYAMLQDIRYEAAARGVFSEEEK